MMSREIFPWSRLGTLAAVALVAGLGCLACTQEPSGFAKEEAPEGPVESTEETQRMVERLARFTSDEELFKNPFENRHRAQNLAALPWPEGATARMNAEMQLALEWLRAGETGKTIERLESLLEMIGEEDKAQARRDRIERVLAIAYLRLGEQENCIDHHHAASCLVPIQASGVHQKRAGSEKAMALYADLLEASPGDLSVRWLYNLAAMTLGEYPDGVPPAWRVSPDTFESEGSMPPFQDVAGAVGVATVEQAGGVVMEDLDGDGLLDVLVSSWGLEDPLVYLRNTGQGTFEDRTEAAGLTGLSGGLNLVHADYDNDGDADVLVLRGGWMSQFGRLPNSLLRNRGDGTFEDVTESAGLLTFFPSQTATWADFDRDGWLDLFVGNESSQGNRYPSELYLNQGDGTFVDIARASGLAVEEFIKGSAWGDVDNDGWPDLYLSTMNGPNRLYRNLGRAADGDLSTGWAFEEIARRAGVDEPEDSFPTWFFDFDNDGWQDLFVAGYGASYLQPVAYQVAADYLGVKDVSEPRLYRNRGDGTFEDVTVSRGLERALMAMGSNFGDLDNDGFLDFYIGTGAPNFTALAPNRMFRNRGGEIFEDVTTAGGFGHIQKGHGIAFGDWDHDGDQDVYAVMGGAFSGDVYANALFENPGHGNRWITLRLEGTDSNRSALGARIQVLTRTAEGPRSIYATVSTGGSFGSASVRQEIGLGQAEAIEWLEITWPSGEVQRFTGVEPETFYRLREGEDAPVALALEPLVRSPATHTHDAGR